MQSIKVLSCTVVLLLSLISSKYNVDFDNSFNGTQYLLSNIVQAPGVVELEYNVIKCSPINVSNTVLNLVLDGFTIEKMDLTEEVIDVALSKEDIVYRIVYQKETESMTLLASPYENIAVLKTYINKE